MRVEVFREPVAINIRLLNEAGQNALTEFFRIVVGSRMADLKPFDDAAHNEGIPYTKGVEVLSYDEKRAVISIYFDIDDETKAIYFKMLMDPIINS